MLVSTAQTLNKMLSAKPHRLHIFLSKCGFKPTLSKLYIVYEWLYNHLFQIFICDETNAINTINSYNAIRKIMWIAAFNNQRESTIVKTTITEEFLILFKYSNNHFSIVYYH